jgi:CheY-like chemotaxis protein
MPGPSWPIPTQMQQILMNLCVNASHAMEKEGGVLQINLSNTVLSQEDTRFDPGVEPGDFVKLTVSDSGDGMELSVLEHIFDPYFTTKEPGKGTGLGLSVVHGIVKSHGGMIKVDSEVGKGTTFTIFLPRAKGFEKIEDTPTQPLARGTEKILFVDDENAIADLGQHLIGELGYHVEIRTSDDRVESGQKNHGNTTGNAHNFMHRFQRAGKRAGRKRHGDLRGSL